MNIKQAGLSIVLGLASVYAFAGGDWDVKPGFYAGIEANRNTASDICIGGLSCDDTDYSWGVMGGYNINDTFSAELGYTDLGRSSLGPFHADTKAWELAGLAKYPVFGGKWAVYARAGWAYSRVNTNFAGGDGNSSSYVYGFGADIPSFFDNIDIRLDYRTYNNVGGSSTDVDSWSVAGVYNF